jgi:hypothetical protein
MYVRSAYLLLAVVGSACSGNAGTGTPGGGGSGGSIGPGGSGGSIGPGGTGMSTPPPNVPVIVSFAANPSVLPTGGGSAMLTWEVMNADSVSIDHGIGTVTGSSTTINVTTSAIYTLTASNGNGSVTAVTAVGVGQNPARGTNGRFASMVSPTGGESFLAPTRLRLVGVARDPLISTNTPSDGHGGNAATVQFFVDDQMVLTVDGLSAQYWVFKGFADGVASGQHRVWLRAIYTNPAEQLDSLPMIVTVYDAPAYAMTVDLTSDMAVPSSGLSLVGTANGRIRVNGNGHSITGSNAGAITLQNVDLVNLGNDSSKLGMDVTTSAAMTIEDCTFDNTNTIRASLGGSATASVKRNVFRSNMRMPIGQQPTSPDSSPAVSFRGASTGAKTFAGNNVGAGWVEFTGVRNWTVGGPTDADSNVLIGPRVGITVASGSTGVTVQRNFSHHVYYGGWSQGANFELQGSPSIVVEHNVIFGSSWPIRGAGCEFRYNLVIDAGHQWLWPEPNGSIHHNVFVGGENDIGGIFLTYNHSGIKVFNNTIDGLDGWKTAVAFQMGSMALTSNAFVNVPNGPTVTVSGGTLTTNYNFFDNPQNNYSDGRRPANDATGDAMLTSPPTRSFDLDKSVVWTRGTSTAAILALYRMRYLPRAGSPLIDTGDPAGGAGNDIGAVGAGTANANDKFGQP